MFAYFILSLSFIPATLFSADAWAGDAFDQCMKAKMATEKIALCSVAISNTRDRRRLERAHLRRGNAYMEVSRFTEAVSDFSATIGLNPDVAGYFDNRQFALKSLGRLNDALRDAERTVQLAPSHSFAYRSRGLVRFGMGDTIEAINDISTAISLDPRDAGLLIERGKIFAASRRYKDAIADFSRALELSPRAFDALRERALAHKALGNVDAARSDISAFAQAHPEDALVAEHAYSQVATKPSIERDDQVRVRMEKEGGVFVVPVLFNGAITLGAIVDSGASDVSIPKDVALTLIRTRTVSETDFLGTQTYVMADGTKVPSPRFLLRSLKVGNRILENVEASIASEQANILLGQSFLGRFKAWAINNEKHELLLK